MEKEKLKELLELTAKESGLEIKGGIANLKTPEQKEAEKDFEEWKDRKSDFIIQNSQTDLYRNYLKLVLEGNIHSLICVSNAGYGKTYTTINLLKEMKKEFVYKSGYITPLSFYCFLFENRDKIIVLDDLTDDIFKDKKMMAILKSCLYEAGGERFISYETTSDKLKVPSKFRFNGKIIILANEVRNDKKEDFNALLSRGIFFRLEYSFEELIIIVNKILEKKELEKQVLKQVLEIIKDNICEVSGFNFRQLEQLIEMVKFNPSKAEELFCHSFRQDEDLILVSKLMKLSISVREQAEKFKEETGFSTRKYYRIKSQIKRRK